MSEFYLEKPLDFDTQVEVSTVFMEYEGKILFLNRTQRELSLEAWAIPGGKLEKGETPLEGLTREISEELNLNADPHKIHYIRSVYISLPKVKYQLHLFRWILASIPTVKLNPLEHHDYLWQPINSVKDLSLLEGQLEAFRLIYN
jgi:8-oxo-dGTP pyrophosphatase MutT (NUDIX family)